MKHFLRGLFTGAAIVAGVLGADELALFFLVALLAIVLFVDDETDDERIRRRRREAWSRFDGGEFRRTR